MKIGNLTLKNNVFLAPMAGITNLPFRTLAREFGCGLAFTEMISANGLVRKTKKSYRYLLSSPDDKPLGVQIFGVDPDVLCEAVRMSTDSGADLIDINMGCPVRKVVKTGAGAALLKEPDRVRRILQAVREATSLPLTIKLRSGWHRGEMRALEIAGIAQDCGVDAVILHPRTADQGYSGAADWSVIEEVKKKLHIPVIGSGDIRSLEDACRMLKTTGCDGIMVGRAALGNPWLLDEIIRHFEDRKNVLPPSSAEREKIIKHHMEMEINYSGECLGLRNFRKHLLWYTKGIRGGSLFREIVGRIHDKNDILDAVHGFFRAIVEGPPMSLKQ
ncbi:MAG: tRNA dihydrouridine synthase DusB [Syntrophales bacterium]|jgi:nifR3 family TIM-barrel protein